VPARTKQQLMKRTARVYLNELNLGKANVVKHFLNQCHDIQQYFIDLFWQRQDFSSKLADLPTVHLAVKRFGITTRLSQALAKQAKETIRSRRKFRTDKPQLRQQTVTLFYHFVKIQPFRGAGFDWSVELIGSGAPRLVIPVKSTKLIQQRFAQGWQLSKTVRMGFNRRGLWIDFIFEKERPPVREEGRVVGMDSNYKAGLVFSDGQVIGGQVYEQIQGFAKRQKHTHAEVKSLMGHALKKLQFSGIKMLCIEDLNRVKSGTRGTFSRRFNRRLSHWLYRTLVQFLERQCEELGIQLVRKNPAYTSQYCRSCNRWDRRNRRGDKFNCVHCGYSDHADHNAAKNLEALGLAGLYGVRLLQSSKCQSFE
jgi:putative transposase